MALKEMTTVLDAEREMLDLESIPEYLTDSPLPSREANVSMASKIFSESQKRFEPPAEQPYVAAPSDADEPHAHAEHLDTLWPGAQQDFTQAGRAPSASLYLTVGFMAGAVVSIIGVFGFSAMSHLMASKNSNANAITVANNSSQQQPVDQPKTVHTDGGGETLTPAAPQVEVQAGDTLAAIALRNYKRVSPRLLDEICKANSMRNANVLNLGQKLSLPEYRTQPTAQIAGAGQIQ